MELYILAYLCNDSNLLEALEAADVFTAMASKLFRKDESEVTIPMRSAAKTTTYGERGKSYYADLIKSWGDSI